VALVAGDLDARHALQPAAGRRLGEDHVEVPATTVDLELLQGSGQDDVPVVDRDDVLAQVLHQIQLVAGEQHGGALVGETLQQLAEGVHAERVEAGERLVEYE
jgi:hypothetical protein